MNTKQNTPMTGAILDYDTLAPADLNLQGLWDLPISWQKYGHTPKADTDNHMRGQSIILTNKVVLDEGLLKGHPELKLIIVLATGTNNVDLSAAKALNIPVCNVVNYSTESVVQHTFAMMLALKTRLVKYSQAVSAGAWSRSPFFTMLDFPITELSGETLGIIGFGSIGKRVKTVAEAFGMRVLVAESLSGATANTGRAPLSTVLKEADVLSIHCPLTPESHNLIDANALSQMKPTAAVINAGRGGIVDELALHEALTRGRLSAAALDVLSQEPPQQEHPLLSLDNVIVTPHIAWASRSARQHLVDQVAEILKTFLASAGAPCELKNRVC